MPRPWSKRDALCAPYAAVIDIDPAQAALGRRKCRGWSTRAVRRRAAARSTLAAVQPASAAVDPRGLQDRGPVGRAVFKMLDACRETIAKNVTGNLYERHLQAAVCRCPPNG